MLKNPNYVYGPRDLSVPMRINFGEFILNKFVSFKDDVAIINESTNTSVTYGELAQKAANLAISLTRLGVRQGEVVAVCSENRMEVWSTLVGISCAGAVMTPLNVGYSQGELSHVLKISKPAYIIASPSCYETHQKTFRVHESLKKIIVFGDEQLPNTISFNDLVKDDVRIEDLEVPDVKGQTDTLFIMYSSGTTGMPKGVMLTHLNVITTLLMPAMHEVPEHRSPAVITVTPWFHVMGLMFFLCDLSAGMKMVTLERFNVDVYMRTIEKYKATHLKVVPPMLIAIAKSDVPYDVSSLKFFMCGAAPLPADLLPAVKARFPGLIAVIQGYGMTENTLVITKDYTDGQSVKYGSVGPVTSGCIMKIADIETRKPLGVRENGEICIKGVTLMKGYIDRDMTEDFDDEGFFRTGDIGCYDEDGYLFIVDRIKELIKYKAYQVPPAEIEAVLLQHSAVRDAGVVGVPDTEGGEVPFAFIATQPGKTVTEKELQDFVAERLSNPKRIRGGVKFVDEIPKNPSGKILRRKLRLMLLNAE